MISIRHKGNLKKTKDFLSRSEQMDYTRILKYYGEKGVQILASMTPIDSGKTASSWDYRIESDDEGFTIVWTNSNINDGVPIAIILQYGHGTGTGGYVQGRDYINPAIQPVMDQLCEDVWKEVND